MLKVRARLSASGGLAQPGPLGEGPVVVALPRHRQPCHELLLRKAVRLRVDACPFLANGLNEVERLLSETAVGLDGEGREGVSLALCKVLVLGSLGVLAHDERVTCHSVNLAFDRGGKRVQLAKARAKARGRKRWRKWSPQKLCQRSSQKCWCCKIFMLAIFRMRKTSTSATM